MRSPWRTTLCNGMCNRFLSAPWWSRKKLTADHRTRWFSAFLVEFLWRFNYQGKTLMSKENIFVVADCKIIPFSLTLSEVGKYWFHPSLWSAHITLKGPTFSALIFFRECLNNLIVFWIFHHYVYVLYILFSEYFHFVLLGGLSPQNTGE